MANYNPTGLPDISIYALPDQTGWSSDHDPRSQEIYNFIAELDFKCFDDFFCWKSGGDGDNGEYLLGELDSYFKYKDEQKALMNKILR